MNRILTKSFLITILFLLNGTGSLFASDEISKKPYNECIFVISNYSGVDANVSESRSIKELLELDIDGFRFNLEWGKKQNQLILKTASGNMTAFLEVLKQIKTKLDSNPKKVLTLFLDFNVNVNELTAIFEKAGLISYLYHHDSYSGWPSIKSMAFDNKRLVVFSMQEHRTSPDWIHYVWNYAVEPYFSLLEAPDFIGEFLKGDPKNDLLIYNDYNFPAKYLSSGKIEFDSNQNPYLIEHIKNIWSRTGKTPNFIMLDSYQVWVRAVLSKLNNFITLNGTVSFNAQLLNYVNWEGRNSLTSGKFCFPAGPGDNLTLTPKSPGYRFKPASITFDEPTLNKVQHFVAAPIELNENLEAHFPFEHNAFDKSSNNLDGSCVGVKFTRDSVRDFVASFDGKSHIVLPKAEAFRIRDHDFTVSAWIKIENYLANKPDYCIIGTPNNSYQEGIHLLIRNTRPYFGFYSNDLAGKTLIEANRWYHLVWRYCKLNGEQAIFVDGKLDSRSLGHPSYKGREKLFVGVAGFSWASNMYGSIDNLTVWSRALGNEEIWSLSKEIIEIVPDKNIFHRYPFIFTIIFGFSVLLLVVSLFLLRKRFRLKKNVSFSGKIYEQVQESSLSPQKNYIQLFGDFKIINKTLEDITDQFTPKIKHLFLLILLFSQRNKKGISTKELSEILWPNYSYQNTKNSRGVTIRKLRIILESMDKVEIIFNIEYWYMKFSADVYCDYLECLKLLNHSKEDDPHFYAQFYQIVQHGEIFKDESHDWLDDFKGYIANNVVDILMKFILKLNMDKDSDFILKLADRILVADPVNDQALGFKLKVLVKQNNYKLARFTYDRFVATYSDMYGEKFSTSFDSIIS